MKHHKRTAASVVAMNSGGYCTAAGCTKHRHGISNLCSTHLVPSSRYGDPYGRPLARSVYQWERDQVASLAAANSKHPAYVAALGYVTGWMARAAASERAYAGAEQVARLIRHGVTPEAVLLEVAALFTYLDRQPRAVPSQRAADFAISRAVFHLAPLPRRVTYSAASKERDYAMRPRTSSLAAVGTHLRQTLAVFLVNIAQSVATRDERAAAALDAMRAPMDVNTGQLMEAAAQPARRLFHHLPGLAP